MGTWIVAEFDGPATLAAAEFVDCPRGRIHGGRVVHGIKFVPAPHNRRLAVPAPGCNIGYAGCDPDALTPELARPVNCLRPGCRADALVSPWRPVLMVLEGRQWGLSLDLFG